MKEERIGVVMHEGDTIKVFGDRKQLEKLAREHVQIILEGTKTSERLMLQRFRCCRRFMVNTIYQNLCEISIPYRIKRLRRPIKRVIREEIHKFLEGE